VFVVLLLGWLLEPSYVWSRDWWLRDRQLVSSRRPDTTVAVTDDLVLPRPGQLLIVVFSSAGLTFPVDVVGSEAVIVTSVRDAIKAAVVCYVVWRLSLEYVTCLSVVG
jgi:hypothetical protein